MRTSTIDDEAVTGVFAAHPPDLARRDLGWDGDLYARLTRDISRLPRVDASAPIAVAPLASRRNVFEREPIASDPPPPWSQHRAAPRRPVAPVPVARSRPGALMICAAALLGAIVMLVCLDDTLRAAALDLARTLVPLG